MQLIPCWIDNVQRVMPKGEVVPVPILCTVTFGAPCNLAPDEPKADFLARARDAVIALQAGRCRMKYLQSLTATQQVGLLFLILFGGLMLVSAGAVLRRDARQVRRRTTTA